MSQDTRFPLAGTTEQLAVFASNLEFGDLPPEVAHQAARVVYDALSCSIAGCETPIGRVYRKAMLSLGGIDEASVIPGHERTSAPMAAFINATFGNARDFDDNLLYHCHIANTVVMAALAVAEARNLDGRRLLTAVTAGYEVAARVTLSMPGFVDFEELPDGEVRTFTPNPIAGFGYNAIGGGVAASSLLRLDPTRTAYAIGLAAYGSPVPSATKACQMERFLLTKPGMFGWQAWSGCLAGLLAEAGVDGDNTALDGPAGFWRMAGARTVFPESLNYKLGSKWWILDTSFKLEPAGTWMRPGLRALRMAMSEGAVQPEQIDRIDVFTRPLFADQAGVFYQKQPETYLDTQVSYYYLMAVAALRVAPERWQLETTYRDPAVHKMIAKIQLHADPESERELQRELLIWPHRASGARTRVVIHADGREWIAESRYGDGDPFDPGTRASDAQLDEKFERFAAPLLKPGQAQRVTEAIWALEAGLESRALVAAVSGA